MNHVSLFSIRLKPQVVIMKRLLTAGRAKGATRTVSAAARRKMAAALRSRWAKVKGAKDLTIFSLKSKALGIRHSLFHGREGQCFQVMRQQTAAIHKESQREPPLREMFILAERPRKVPVRRRF